MTGTLTPSRDLPPTAPSAALLPFTLGHHGLKMLPAPAPCIHAPCISWHGRWSPPFPSPHRSALSRQALLTHVPEDQKPEAPSKTLFSLNKSGCPAAICKGSSKYFAAVGRSDTCQGAQGGVPHTEREGHTRASGPRDLWQGQSQKPHD